MLIIGKLNGVTLIFIHSFIRSFIHSFIHSFMHSFIHSFIHSCNTNILQAIISCSKLLIRQCFPIDLFSPVSVIFLIFFSAVVFQIFRYIIFLLLLSRSSVILFFRCCYPCLPLYFFSAVLFQIFRVC